MSGGGKRGGSKRGEERKVVDLLAAASALGLRTIRNEAKASLAKRVRAEEVAREQADADEAGEEEEEESQAALGKDWTEYVDGNGRPYYYNSVDKQTTWTRPPPPPPLSLIHI